MTYKYTVVGPTGRAQLIVEDMTGESVPLRKRRDRPDFCVRLLSRRAHRSTSFSSAGDRAYYGPNLDIALMHIAAWTGLAEVPLPAILQRFAEQAAAV